MIKAINNDTIHWTCICGTENTPHISDEQLRWKTEQEIHLPPCSKCGAIANIRVHDDEELTPPVIARDEGSGKILQVAPAEHPKYSGNLWKKHSDIVRHPQPHPTLANLSEAEIKELQAYNRSKAPDVPVDWMLTETTREVIHSVTQHPAVALHRQLASLMKQHGKEFVPPDEHVTAPRMPAIQISQLSPPTLEE